MRSKKTKRVLFSAVIAVILVAGLLLTGCSGKKEKQEAVKQPAITSAEALPKMVDFWSPTCPPCRAMMPMLEELHTEYAHAFELVKIDVSQPENQNLAIQNQIQYIPTQIFYDENGKQLFRHTGYFSKDQILGKWKELGYDMSPAK
jgi:thioredoxin 1